LGSKPLRGRFSGAHAEMRITKQRKMILCGSKLFLLNNFFMIRDIIFYFAIFDYIKTGYPL
jgi:hypothetical protein